MTVPLVERYRDFMTNPTFSLGIYAFANLRAFLENRPLRFVGLGPAGDIDRDAWRFFILPRDDGDRTPRPPGSSYY